MTLIYNMIYYLKSVNNSAKSMTKHNEGTQEVTSKGLQLKSTSSQFKGTSVWLHNQTSAAEQCLAWLSTVTCRQWCRWRRRQWRLWCLQEPGSLRGNIPPASQSPPWPCPSPPATIPPVRHIFRATQAAADWRLTGGFLPRLWDRPRRFCPPPSSPNERWFPSAW